MQHRCFRFMGFGLIFSVLLINPNNVRAQAATGFSLSEWEDLKQISLADFEVLRARDPEITQDLESKEIKVLDTRAALNLYARVSDDGLGWGPLRAFGDEIFLTKRKALFVPKEVLLAVDRQYESHLLYVMQGITSADVNHRGKTVPRGKPFTIDGLLCGNGGLMWVLYPHPIVFHSNEYDFYTGNFSLYYTNKMVINRDANGRIVFQELVGRNDPSLNFQAIRGPFNMPIKRFVLSDDEKHILVYIPILGHQLTVPHKTINRRKELLSIHDSFSGHAFR